MKIYTSLLCCLITFFFIAAPFTITDSNAKEDLVFGAIAVGKVSKVKKSLTPFLDYLSQKTGKSIKFETGKDYPDTIQKFQSGYFDFGYIGPSPYVIATSGPKGPGIFKLMAGIETNNKPYFYAAIIAAKDDATINSLNDLKGKKFAFGSRQSTLSCYMPAKMLMDAGVFDELEVYDFLGKHDKVAKYVAMGGYAAGGVKIAVAEKNLSKIKIIAKSDPVYDFLMVAHHTMDETLYTTLKSAILELKDPAVFGTIKKGLTGFIEAEDKNYDSLREVMTLVDKKIPK